MANKVNPILDSQLEPSVCVGCKFLRPFIQKETPSEHYGLCSWWADNMPFWTESWLHGTHHARSSGMLTNLKHNTSHPKIICSARESE